MKKITRVSDLPKWFDLKKYEGLSNFSVKEWSRIILFRFCVESAVIDGEWRELIPQEMINKMFENPLDLQKSWHFVPPQDEEPENLKFGTVSSFDVRQASYVCSEFKKMPREYKEAFKADSIGLVSAEQERLLRMPYEIGLSLAFGYGPENWTNPHLAIELSAPDEMLIADFKRWLENARKIFELPSRENIVNESELSGWIDQKIVPYIDLVLWSEIEGVTIPLHVIGEALFPDGIDGNLAERVRKTVRKKAQQVFTESMAMALASQAAKN